MLSIVGVGCVARVERAVIVRIVVEQCHECRIALYPLWNSDFNVVSDARADTLGGANEVAVPRIEDNEATLRQ